MSPVFTHGDGDPTPVASRYAHPRSAAAEGSPAGGPDGPLPYIAFRNVSLVTTRQKMHNADLFQSDR